MIRVELARPCFMPVRHLAACLVGKRRIHVSCNSINALLEVVRATDLEVKQVPGAGRGLYATKDIRYGAVIHSEVPLLCYPSLSNPAKLCYHCLKVLPPTTLTVLQHPSGRTFCSSSCLQQARVSYLAVESRCEFMELQQLCAQQQERFPLLAARLACMQLSQALGPGGLQQLEGAAEAAGASGAAAEASGSAPAAARASGGLVASISIPTAAAAPAPAPGAAATPAPVEGPAQQLLQHLCFANVPKPYPSPWVEAHGLLLQGVQRLLQSRPALPNSPAVQAAAAALDVDWFVASLARVHINAFRVESLLPLALSGSLHAAPLMQQQQQQQQQSADADPCITGTAVYLLASLFNHSCDPSVNVSFPQHDSKAVFTAARDISAGEQLEITYIDADASVRQRQQLLHWGYGFRCRCQRCQEELAELQPGQ